MAIVYTFYWSHRGILFKFFRGKQQELVGPNPSVRVKPPENDRLFLEFVKNTKNQKTMQNI